MIRDSFWTDSYIERLTPDEKLIFIYLLTNPLCNIAGIYEIRPKRIAFETGYDIEVIENILGRFVRDQKILRHNDWIVLVNSIKNQALNPSVIQGCNRIIMALPSDMLAQVTGWVQAGLLNLTLLNLTLPNLTEPAEPEETEEPVRGDLVSDVIKAFELVDAKNKLYYGNKTQRAACQFLLDEYGLAEVKSRLMVLPKTNGMPFFPNITTPVQLRDKWTQLEAAITRHRAEQANGNSVAF